MSSKIFPGKKFEINFKKYINSLISGVFTADIDTLMEDVKANAPMIAMMVKLAMICTKNVRNRKKTVE